MKRKNKGTIAILGEGFSTSGKSQFITNIFERIKKKTNAELFLRETAPYNKKDVVKIKTFKIGARILAGLGYFIPLFLELRKRRDIYFIHAYDERLAFFASFLEVPFVATVHDIYSLYKFPFGFLFRIMYRSLRKAEYVMVDSDNTGKMLKKEIPSLSNKIVTVHLGIDIKRFKSRKKPNRRNNKRKPITLGVLGKFDWTLVNVFKKISQNYKEKVKIFLGGKVSQEKLDELKKIPEVEVKGFIEESQLAAYYRSIDIFVYKKRGEGFGLIPLEAMASGCAVVVSNSASLPEVVGKGGILVKNNEKEFYNAIKKLIEDKKLRKHYSKAGRKRAEELTWEACAGKIFKIYEKALKKKLKNK